jgi:hypothetical protein
VEFVAVNTTCSPCSSRRPTSPCTSGAHSSRRGPRPRGRTRARPGASAMGGDYDRT